MEAQKQRLVKIIKICLCSLVAAICLEKVISTLPFLRTQYFSTERLLVLFLVVLSTSLLIAYRKFFAKNLHWAFVVIAISLGLAMVVVFPRTTHVSQDDIAHFPLAYRFLSSEIDQTYGLQMFLTQETSTTIGQSFAKRDTTYKNINDAHTEVIDPTLVSNVEVQPYKTLVYLPFYLGFQISAFLRLNLTTSAAIAKFCNFLCYVTLMFFAIYLSKNFQKVFFLIALFVTNFFYATQFSYDPTVTASIVLAIAIFLRAMSEKRISPKLALAFTFSLSWGCLVKAIYCPLFLLVLLIPNYAFDVKRRAIAYKVCNIILMVVIASTFVLPMLNGGMGGDVRGGLTSVSGQLSAMLSSPLHATGIFGLFLVRALPGLIFGQNSTIGFGEPSEAAYLYTRFVLNLVFFIELIFMLYAVFSEHSVLKMKHKLVLAAVYLIITLAIIGALYLSFTPVGATSIEGVQARYFLPILPLFLLILVPFNRQSPSSIKNNYLTIIVPYFCLMAILLTFVARITML